MKFIIPFFIFLVLILTFPINKGHIEVKEKEEELPPLCNFLYPDIKYINGIPILVAEGSPKEIGSQVAKLAVEPAKKAHGYARQMFDNAVHGKIIQRLAWKRAISTGEQLIKNSPVDYQIEFNEIAKKMDRDLAVAGNTLFDIKNNYSINLGCSTIAILPEKSTTGNLIFGRNLDYPSNGYLNHYSLVTVYKPNNKKSFISLTFPGLVGCLTGVNEDGLCIAVLEVKALKKGATKFNKNGIPYAFCYRKILEECSTISEAKVLLSKLKIDTATNLAICDKKSASILEITPDGFVEKVSDKGFCCCTNHFCVSPFKSRNISENSAKRLISLTSSATKNKLNFTDIQKALDDVNSDTETIQTIIIEPATMTLYIGIGNCPTTKLKLRKLDGNKLFQRKAD